MNIFDSNSIVKEISLKNDLSLVVITHKRLDLLKGFAHSLKLAFNKHSHFKCNIVFCINGADSETENLLKQLNSEYPSGIYTQVITLEKAVSPAEARNIATASVQTEWIGFLDDDVEVPEDLLINFQNIVKLNPSSSLLGGPNLTPEQSTLVQKKIGWLLQNYMVTGPISYRYKLNNIKSMDCSGLYFSLCNIFVKTKDFKNIYFNASLKTAEENELIYKFSKQDIKMNFSDLLYVWHSRRTSIENFLTQIENYGYGRGQLIFNGMTPLWVLIFSALAMTTILFFTYRYPIAAALFLIAWLTTIFINSSIHFKFKEQKISDIILPLMIWYKYFFGISNGYFKSYKLSKLH